MEIRLKAVFDTNILIDYLNGVDNARRELSTYDETIISVITWMEVLAGVTDDGEDAVVRRFLRSFALHRVTDEIAERAVKIRRSAGIRLPDAIIWATAQESGYQLVTRNTRDFPEGNPGIRIPYRI